jgi:hypothetical protein
MIRQRREARAQIRDACLIDLFVPKCPGVANCAILVEEPPLRRADGARVYESAQAAPAQAKLTRQRSEFGSRLSSAEWQERHDFVGGLNERGKVLSVIAELTCQSHEQREYLAD